MASWTDSTGARPAPPHSPIPVSPRPSRGASLPHAPVHGLGTRAPRVMPAPPPALLSPGEAERPGAFARVEA